MLNKFKYNSGRRILCVGIIVLLLMVPTPFIYAQDVNKLPAEGMATMISLGSKRRVPSRMMIPILANLEAAYKDQAVIAYIDVFENPELASPFGNNAIPTQIFFNAEGAEVTRQVGFMSEADIVTIFEQMGVKKTEENQ